MAEPAKLPREIEVPETFHRLKRTSILLCAVLIVLVCATPTQSTELELTLVKLKISTWIAELLVWIAAAYYFVGFYLEYRMARQFNAAALEDRAGPFLEQIKSLSSMFNQEALAARSHAITLKKSQENFEASAEQALNVLKSIPALFDPSRRRLFISHEGSWPEAPNERAEMKNLLEAYSTEADLLRGLRSIENNVANAAAACQNAEKHAEASKGAIGKATLALRRERKRLEALAPSIYRERKFLLVWWEFGSTALLFAVANLATCWPYHVAGRQTIPQLR